MTPLALCLRLCLRERAGLALFCSSGNAPFISLSRPFAVDNAFSILLWCPRGSARLPDRHVCERSGHGSVGRRSRAVRALGRSLVAMRVSLPADLPVARSLRRPCGVPRCLRHRLPVPQRIRVRLDLWLQARVGVPTWVLLRSSHSRVRGLQGRSAARAVLRSAARLSGVPTGETCAAHLRDCISDLVALLCPSASPPSRSCRLLTRRSAKPQAVNGALVRPNALALATTSTTHSSSAPRTASSDAYARRAPSWILSLDASQSRHANQRRAAWA